MTVEAADVVISGAGPNGLMLACELALAGVRPVVLDKLPGPSDEPKANGLVGQVIRQLDMRDLYHTFGGDEGPPEPAYGWMFAGVSLNFLGIEDNPMYALLIQQPRVVRLLEKRARDLGVDIRWGHELTAMRAGGDNVALTVTTAGPGVPHGRRLPGGRRRWPQHGAQGGGHRLSRSHVADRQQGRPRVPARRAPCPGSWLRDPGLRPITVRPQQVRNGTVIAFPLEPARPMLGSIEYGWTVGSAEGPMTLDELRDSLRRIIGVDVPLEAPKGPGPHALRRLDGTNSRQAERYREGRVLLLGDAAHVHSPMGGPGLNLGMQDAVNLGWKLAGVVNGWAPAGLLDTYESERYPVGERVMMHSQAQLALAAPGPEVAALRELFGELAGKPDVASHLAGLLAGSDVRYDVGDDHPLSGLLVPDLVLDDGRRIADLLHDARPVLLDLSGGAASAAAAAWSDRVNAVTAAMTDGPGALLIRPDGYVAWATDTFEADDAAALRIALTRWFGVRAASRECSP